MDKFAIIKNGVVENVILANQEMVIKSNLDGVFSDVAKIGDNYQGGQFVTPQNLNHNKFFTAIKPMYMRLALDHFNILETIEAALELPENKAKKIAFEYALQFERDDEMINGFAQSFGLTTEQVDEIFEYAESIQK